MRIVVAEDMLMFREVIVTVCRRGGHTVVAGVGSGKDALNACREAHPDLLLLDLELPGGGGVAVMDGLAADKSQPKILVMSAHLTDYVAYRIERSIANGFLDKNVHTPKALLEAVEALARGRTWFSPTFFQINQHRRRNSQSFDKLLTDAEQTVLQMAGKGMADGEIATRLGVSVRTCEGHRSRVLHKLGLDSTAQLLMYAHQKRIHLFGE